MSAWVEQQKEISGILLAKMVMTLHDPKAAPHPVVGEPEPMPPRHCNLRFLALGAAAHRLGPSSPRILHGGGEGSGGGVIDVVDECEMRADTHPSLQFTTLKITDITNTYKLAAMADSTSAGNGELGESP